jgi:MFS family permease
VNRITMMEASGKPRRAVCRQCDKMIVADASFCGFCGTRNPGAPHNSLGGAAAILITLAWLPIMAFFFSNPMGDEASRLLFLYALGMLSPIIFLLVVALLLVRSAGNTTMGSGVAGLIAVTWLVASMILSSRPSTAFVAQIDWIIYTLGLLAAWLVVLIPAAYRSWRLFRRAALPKIAAYLLPVPLAIVAFLALVSFDLAEDTRLQLTEKALKGHIKQFESTGISRESRLVGLVRVEKTYREEGCVMLRLGQSSFLGVWNENGIAYCPDGQPPDARSLYLSHEYRDWWTYATTNS